MIITRAINSRINARLKIDVTLDKVNTPIFSVVMPVFNQADIVFKHLEAITQSMTLPFELIVINDASKDKTDSEIRRFISSYASRNSSCVKIKYFSNLWPWFETRCDDFGFRVSSAEYILEIQADMLIMQNGVDEILLEIMEQDTKIFALSARGVHKLDSVLENLGRQKGSEISDRLIQIKLINKVKFKVKKEIGKYFASSPKEICNSENIYATTSQEKDSTLDLIFPRKGKSLSEIAGFLGNLIDILPYDEDSKMSEEIEKNLGNVWFGETVMRGPLVIRKNYYITLGGFNVDAFYLGNDDHDLFLRARDENFKVGFTPIKFAAPLKLGNARKKRKISSKIFSKMHRAIRKKEYTRSRLMREFRSYNFD